MDLKNKMKTVRFATIAFTFLAVFFVAHGVSAASIYYSVGQTTSNLMTGAPTVTIASGTATFSTAQTGNIGVGDRVTYNTSDIAYISGKTSTSVWTLITKTGAVPADIITSAVVSITREYTSLAAAEAGATDANHLNTTDLVTNNYQLNFPCYYDTGADTTMVNVSGYTTGENNYIKIYTPNNTTTEANNSQRHSGKWDDGKYRLEVSGNYSIYLTSAYVRIEGLQLVLAKNSSGGGGAVYIGANTASSSIRVGGNMIKARFSDAASMGYGITTDYCTSNVNVFNNVIYGFSFNGSTNMAGIYLCGGLTFIYNNTVYGSYTGIKNYNSGPTLKNNIANGNTIDYSGEFNTYGSNNISQDATSPDISLRSTTVQFLDAPNKDFHLSPSDTAAKNSGADLSADANLAFTTDIDGQTRPSSSSTVWDIGADEAATAIYYSVGQNTSSHETGAGTVTVDATARIATFSVAQTATNMGVGDLVTYTGGSCYITNKTSTAVWGCQSATGTAPTAATNADVTSIAHAYASLSAAEAGAPTLLGTSDLATGNYQLNFPCYYDTGADTTAVTIDGYTTGVSNYIKIYTPNNTTTEANNSQRHQGKAGTGYRMFGPGNVPPITISDNYVRVEGLEVENQTSGGGTSMGTHGLIRVNNVIAPNDSDIYISHNIVHHTTSMYNSGIAISTDAAVKVYNNFVYDIYASGIYTPASATDNKVQIYNNVVYKANQYNDPSFRAGVAILDTNNAILKNNIIIGTPFHDVINPGYAAAGSGYNITSDATAPGSNSKTNTIPAMADFNNFDFHLSPFDTAAKNSGADLSADANFAFATDIDGQTRPSSSSTVWDIGADEAATAIYYSVGQNTSSHETGAGTVTVDATARIATFSVAQTATNMGVGDLVTYTGGSCYITNKTSTTVWGCQSATGTAPTAATNADVTSIAHAFASLSAAEAGAPTLLGTSDLATGNYQLNFPCYYDTGADTTSLSISGYITSSSNYIKIYTPNNTTTEVNQSQRHQGKWDEGKYRLVVAVGFGYVVGIEDKYVWLDGLQVDNSADKSNQIKGIRTPPSGLNSLIRFSNLIVRASGPGVPSNVSIGVYLDGSLNYDLWNNVVYGYFGGIISDYESSLCKYQLYNNTVFGNTGIGIGLTGNTAPNLNLINNLSNSNAIDFSTSNLDSFSNNISQDATSPDVALRSKTVQFLDSANGDFHLALTDTAARKAGVNINLQEGTHLRFGEDIDGQGRAGDWDIGADESQETQLGKSVPADNLESGLVGHWTFDGKDISGTTVKDVSGNGKDGTNSGATPAMGKLGQGMGFDGVNDYIRANDLDLTQLTLSAWIKYSSCSGDGSTCYIISKGQNDTSSNYNMEVLFNYIRFNIGGGGIISASTYNDDKWHHVVGTFDNVDRKLFIDGAEIASAAGGLAPQSDELMTIGGDDSVPTYRPFNGSLDDVRIYNRALSENEIGQLYHLGQNKVAAPESSTGNKNGLVGYWSFDGPTISGTTVSDLSGNGNNGTISGATPALGKVGQGMGFDGSSSSISIPDNDYFSPYINDLTISFWANVPVGAQATGNGVCGGAGKYFAAKAMPGYAEWGIENDNNSRICFNLWRDDGSSHGTISSLRTINDDNWHHYVATVDYLNNMSLFIDGESIASSSSFVGTMVNGNRPVLIGRAEFGSYFLEGLMDEFRIYNRTLSESEIINLYNIGKVEIRR